MGSKRISVLVVDDSTFIRKAILRMLQTDPLIEVIGEAGDGLEAIKKIRDLKPDVVTLDVKMTGMDGIGVLKRIMKDNPTPVIMVSSMTSEDGAVTMRALEAGAMDFIDKSLCKTSMDIMDLADLLINKVKAISKVDITNISVKDMFVIKQDAEENNKKNKSIRLSRTLGQKKQSAPSHLVAIGTSTGGPMSLEKILTPIPYGYPGAILVVQHMPEGFTQSFADRLNNCCSLVVSEARHGEMLTPGNIYIAPGGRHMRICRIHDSYEILIDSEPLDNIHCPSVDVLMESIAEVWKSRVLGIIMTGMGNDGAYGVRQLKKKGARVIAQDKDSCIVYGMPKAALKTGDVDKMVSLDKIASEIIRF